jgi:hypothetical protein
VSTTPPFKAPVGNCQIAVVSWWLDELFDPPGFGVPEWLCRAQKCLHGWKQPSSGGFVRVMAGAGDLDHHGVRHALGERSVVSRRDGGVVGPPRNEYRDVAE